MARLPAICAGRKCLSLLRRSRSFSAPSSPSPSKPPTTWERSAKIVKNADVTNPYLERVRSEVVDPALQLKTIEDELCGAIGKALGRQGEKVLIAMQEMREERTRFLEHADDRSFEEALRSARRHNEARRRAMKARWELLVHRQAVGFTVDNHSVVHSTFPIGEALPAKLNEILAIPSPNGCNSRSVSSDISSSSEELPTSKKKWGDQLSWWQKVGRWM